MKDNNEKDNSSTDDSASERAAALLLQASEVVHLVETAPKSPVEKFLSAKQRRQMRRSIERLRSGEVQPKYKNLYTAEQLADIYEQTIRRDEIRERTRGQFERISHEIGRAMRENGPGVRKAFDALFVGTLRSAREDGPDSEAAQRYRQLQSLVRFVRRWGVDERRQKLPDPDAPVVPHDPAGRLPLIAAEPLASLPSSGEAVVAIPPEGKDSGRGRVLMRIGVGNDSWIGSFERGHMNVSTIFIMPDGKHLFVSAQGAGYIIDLKSRTLVETVGLEVAGIVRDGPMTIFVVDHNGTSLEAFGTAGRLWKTGPIACGGFREWAISDTDLLGQARQAFPPRWVGFSVELATGEVRFEDGLRR